MSEGSHAVKEPFDARVEIERIIRRQNKLHERQVKDAAFTRALELATDPAKAEEALKHINVLNKKSTAAHFNLCAIGEILALVDKDIPLLVKAARWIRRNLSVDSVQWVKKEDLALENWIELVKNDIDFDKPLRELTTGRPGSHD